MISITRGNPSAAEVAALVGVLAVLAARAEARRRAASRVDSSPAPWIRGRGRYVAAGAWNQPPPRTR